MPIKESLEENKQFILDSLPSEELKQEFLTSLEKVEETNLTSVDEQISEAQAPDHISEDMYDAVKKEIEGYQTVAAMSEEETQQAIVKETEQVDTTPKDEEGNPIE